MLKDHILMDSPEKMTQNGVNEMGLFDHELIYCSRKLSCLKLNECDQVSLRLMRNYSDEIFVEQVRSRKCPGY